MCGDPQKMMIINMTSITENTTEKIVGLGISLDLRRMSLDIHRKVNK